MIDLMAPESVYPELFEVVQRGGIFGDSKSFVDAVPRGEPAHIVALFNEARHRPDFDLADFLAGHFDLPADPDAAAAPDSGRPVHQHIDRMWNALTRGPDDGARPSSLIPLPYPYVVPGGRFREIYYWDSYFTMLGLAASGRPDLARSMIENVAYLIDTIGFVPNGNRSYFCSRSQPPLFAFMVEFWAGVQNDNDVYRKYFPQLAREYEFWMRGADELRAPGEASRRVLLTEAGFMNRYWDDLATPRPESFREDEALAAGSGREAAGVYRDIRAACESGWDFSSRWCADAQSLASICTTQIVPVDLNAALYKLESVLAYTATLSGDGSAAKIYTARADSRRETIQALCKRVPASSRRIALATINSLSIATQQGFHFPSESA